MSSTRALLPLGSPLGSLWLALALLTAPALGATPGPIEEIVVRGELRTPSLQDMPASVSVISPEAAKQTLVNHLEEVLGWVPNVNFASGGARARFLQIRGIGERGQFSEPLNSSVGLLLDGVDLSGVGTVASLFDVQQVEVLRGPQGTLYGANALAGLINLRSNDPTPAFSGRVQLDAGNYGAQGIGMALAGPLGERAGFRLAARRYEDDGYIDNVFLDVDDTNHHQETTIRGKLTLEPVDALALTLAAGQIDIDSGYDAFSLDNNRRTRSDEPGRDQQETRYGNIQADWLLKSDTRLQSTLAWATTESFYGYDEDWTYLGFHPDGYSSTDSYQRDRDTVSIDVRLLSEPGTGLWQDRIDWVVGLYRLRQDVELERRYTFLGAPFTSSFEIKRLALYGELTTQLASRTRLTTGLRLEQHESNYDDSQALRFSPEDDLVGGRVILEQDLSDSSLAYLSLSRGYKAGGFNTDGSLDLDLREFDPEVLWNYELGLKTLLLEDRLAIRGALFLMDRKDMQVGTSITRVRANGSAEFIDFLGNAAKGRNYGLELELDYGVNEHWRLFGSLGLLRTEFREYTNGSGEDLDGRDQSQAPEYSFHLGAEYQITPHWFARLEFEGKADYFVSDSHAEKAPSYELVNAVVGYATERWQIKLWGRNLSDEEYVVRGFYFGNDPRDGYTTRGFNQLGEPRRVGISAELQF